MKLKGVLSKPLASYIANDIKKWSNNPFQTQEKVFADLISKGKGTSFGKDHNFNEIKSYKEFKEKVPLKDYEGLKPYINRLKNGEESVLWPGKPLYFAKTSGTTSGVKFIPISNESISNHIDSARNSLMTYVNETGNSSFFNGGMIFLSGSPVLGKTAGINTGRLSGIVNHHIPAWLKGNQLPTYKTNCIDDWETKVEAIVKETVDHDMRLLSGIPPWLLMYFERLIHESGQLVGELFPKFSVLAHGGVNFEPYRQAIFEKIGREVDTIETYPASEGFIAFQDTQASKGLLLVLNKGIFYEFVPANEIHKENPTRLSLEDVEEDVNYAIVLNTNAGLWGYILGDTVKFISTKPYRLLVTGRISHYLSAFGEHIIVEEAESSLLLAMDKTGVKIREYTVAPQVNPPSGEKPYHEWFIEFEEEPNELHTFASALDSFLVKKNIYYKDLIEGKILQPLKITPIKPNGFVEYMRKEGKLGGQNKVAHLSNDRTIANKLQEFIKN